MAALADLQLSEAEAIQVAQLVVVDKDFVKRLGHSEAAAVALQGPKEAWQLPLAKRLLKELDGESPEWLLRHALRWPEVKSPLEKLAESYSVLRGEALKRKLLLAAAKKGTGCWSFREWHLLPWRNWQWDLEQRRVRSTTEHFRFNETLDSEQARHKHRYHMISCILDHM